jgi:hypothetical protein
MHVEFLVEDSSGAKLVENLLPKIIGNQGKPHTWHIHSYKGIGHLPKDLRGKGDPEKRVLLAQLPRLLKGYLSVPTVNAVVVVVDSDRRDGKKFLAELEGVAATMKSTHKPKSKQKTAVFLAIEEIEAWYLGDHAAIYAAYPKAKRQVLTGYKQDSVCDTWELLADAIEPGGRGPFETGGRNAGAAKNEWAIRIGPLLDPHRNRSPSFIQFRDGLKQLVP